MARAKVGDRVAAIMSANDGVMKLFGFGVRQEDKVPPKDAGGFGSAMHEANVTNPCILLDSGKEVFGCECWWGPESFVKERYADWEFVEVDVDEVRKEVAGG